MALTMNAIDKAFTLAVTCVAAIFLVAASQEEDPRPLASSVDWEASDSGVDTRIEIDTAIDDADGCPASVLVRVGEPDHEWRRLPVRREMTETGIACIIYEVRDALP